MRSIRLLAFLITLPVFFISGCSTDDGKKKIKSAINQCNEKRNEIAEQIESKYGDRLFAASLPCGFTSLRSGVLSVFVPQKTKEQALGKKPYFPGGPQNSVERAFPATCSTCLLVKKHTQPFVESFPEAPEGQEYLIHYQEDLEGGETQWDWSLELLPEEQAEQRAETINEKPLQFAETTPPVTLKEEHTAYTDLVIGKMSYVWKGFQAVFKEPGEVRIHQQKQ